MNHRLTEGKPPPDRPRRNLTGHDGELTAQPPVCRPATGHRPTDRPARLELHPRPHGHRPGRPDLPSARPDRPRRRRPRHRLVRRP
ncbi:hypothetical protein F7R91_21720 [Streptomyces luteolifulvus]|uniref:Uncharacterized protein n=1 Tax=Streptomyces luteolifulvus TaxID=2615112 RepID=A0A6H9UWY1_9ACTN|nr:hypothetical protein F7R91_21720 [Streptomyces luteolifulvus]